MFAKSFRWLKAKFNICVAFYNVIRPHETLSRGKDRIFRPKTPAMAAGITTHQWSIKELLTAHVYVNSIRTSPAPSIFIILISETP